MSDKNELANTARHSVSNLLRELADGIDEGAVGSYRFGQTDKGAFTFEVDSPDGQQRKIYSEIQFGGYQKTSTEDIQKESPEKRRQTVKMLREQGLPQEQIAKYTLRSQKTISNDIRILRDRGELDDAL